MVSVCVCVCVCALPSPSIQECVSALLSFSGVEDLQDSEGRTAVMWAAQRGNYNVLKAMLDKQIPPTTADKSGATGTYMYTAL